MFLSLLCSGLSASMQGPLNAQSLQSSLSNPNIQSSLSSHSFPVSPASLHSSLSNPSLQSSHSSPPSLPPPLNNSSLGGKPLQSSAGNLGFGGGGAGVPSSCASSYPPLLAGQGQPRLCTSPRRRAHLSPLILPGSADARRHHSKQFSPTVSPTLSSITQVKPGDECHALLASAIILISQSESGLSPSVFILGLQKRILYVINRQSTSHLGQNV